MTRPLGIARHSYLLCKQVAHSVRELGRGLIECPLGLGDLLATPSQPSTALQSGLQSGLILEVGLVRGCARSYPAGLAHPGSGNDIKHLVIPVDPVPGTLGCGSGSEGPKWYPEGTPLLSQLACSKTYGSGLPHLGSGAVVEPISGNPP